MNQKDKFLGRADSYDSVSYRINYIDEMAKSIINSTKLNRDMTIIDFGAGTGLLTQRVSSYVKKIIAIDSSASMASKLREKRDIIECDLEIKVVDITKESFDIEAVDGIISTMTLHHIKDIESLFKKFYTLVKDGGFLAICDIDKEDGTFHTVDSGIEHYGFDRDEFKLWCKKGGFKDIKIADGVDIVKPHGVFSSFILTAKKP